MSFDLSRLISSANSSEELDAVVSKIVEENPDSLDLLLYFPLICSKKANLAKEKNEHER